MVGGEVELLQGAVDVKLVHGGRWGGGDFLLDQEGRQQSAGLR